MAITNVLQATLVAGPMSVGFDLSPDAATPANNTYIDAGRTQGGFVAEYEATGEMVDVDQETFDVGALLVKEGFKFTVNLAEGSLVNIANAMGGAAISGATVTLGPTAGSTLKSMALEFVGNAPGAGNTRTIEVFLAVVLDNVALPFKKDGITFVPTTFRAILDGTNPAADIVDT